MSTEDIHEEKLTITVDINIPGHDPRVTTSLFIHTKKQLVEREKGKCFICGKTAEESGHPLEAHHHPIERSLANMIDWPRFEADCHAGLWGQEAKDFNWEKFDPKDPYSFVDNMLVNGELLCKEHHTGKDEGKHLLPFPIWIAQRYAIEGYKFSGVEIIHHEG